jgi:TonB family protein
MGTITDKEDYMRRIVAASFLLSPLLFTASAVASQPAADDATSNPAIRVSSGVVPAQIVSFPMRIAFPTDPLSATIPQDAEVGVQFLVDVSGKAKDIQVTDSVSPVLDEQVINAVRETRFIPAKLDNQAVPITMNLEVKVQH